MPRRALAVMLAALAWGCGGTEPQAGSGSGTTGSSSKLAVAQSSSALSTLSPIVPLPTIGSNAKASTPASNTDTGNTLWDPNGLPYQGGPLMLGTPNIYFIWYGNWSGRSATQDLLVTWAENFGGTPYYNINTTYYDAQSSALTNAVKYAGSATDGYSQGTKLNDNGVFAAVANAIGTNALPADTNGVYFVLSSPDVVETSGFCKSYCAWHNHTSINGQDIKVAFVGDPAQCPSFCEWQPVISPNGDLSGDAMATLVSHEFEESTSDPDINAWVTNQNTENADKCVWTFGTEYQVPNGSFANMKFGGKNWLIQRNWVNAGGGYCSLSYP